MALNWYKQITKFIVYLYYITVSLKSLTTTSLLGKIKVEVLKACSSDDLMRQE